MRRWAVATLGVLIGAALIFGALTRFTAPHVTANSPMRVPEVGLLLLEDEAGLYVLGVIDGSLACGAGILPGDYLINARGTALNTVSQLEDLLAAQESDPMPVTLGRQEQTLTVQLPLR